jgi:ubiquinone/menaquinone biosynthesis C-methylase UbiE
MSEGHGLLFDHVAEDYDRVRRDYPAALVDEACSIAGLAAGSRVLEVGCGTGKLTSALAARGLNVDAVDPGAALVAIARGRVGDAPVRFHVARFEDVNLRAGTFEAVFSATAFHWVDPVVSWPKAARLLRPGGALALLTHVGGWLLELEPEFLAAWREVLPEAAGWAARDPETLWRGAEARRANVSELWAWLVKRELGRPEAAGLFGDVGIDRVQIDLEETADELLAVLRTTSAYLRLDQPRRDRLEARLTALVEKAGGIYRSTMFATLVTARAR